MITGHDIHWLLDDALYTVPRVTKERGKDMDSTDMNVGDHVTINNESYGWGAVRQGHIGIVREILNSTVLFLDIPGVFSHWQCTKSDVTLVSGSSNMSLNNYIQRCTETLQDKKAETQRCINSYECSLKACTESIDGIVKPNGKAFEQIADSVREIRMTYPKFSFITNPIVIPYYMHALHRTLHIEMGAYKVACNMRDGRHSTVIEPWDGTNRTRDGYPHPHVNGGYDPCWGTYMKDINECYKTIDVVRYVSIVLDFLSSCDKEGWYISVLKWADPDDLVDLCSSCACHVDSCECDENRCSGCGNDEDDCECTRCPDSNDRLDDNSFPDIGCVTCPNLCKNIPAERWECNYNNSDGYPYFYIPLSHFTPTGNESNHEYETITD